jgi:hypothetical protein
MLNNSSCSSLKNFSTFALSNALDLETEVAYGDLSDKTERMHRTNCCQSFPADFFIVKTVPELIFLPIEIPEVLKLLLGAHNDGHSSLKYNFSIRLLGVW